MDQQHPAEVIIIGGGLAGLTQSLMLGLKDINTVCIDQGSVEDLINPEINGRNTVISYGSHQLFKASGIWEDIKPHACPINDIQILDGNSPVLLDFSDQDRQENETAFGWNIENYIIYKALLKAIEKQKSVSHITQSKIKEIQYQGDAIAVILQDNTQYNASLLIGADGRKSYTREWMGVNAREWSYDQKAIVTVVEHEKPHHNKAIEHFKVEGPLAILPMLDREQGKHRSSIVWTQDQNSNAINYDEKTFLIAINNLFPNSYGAITAVQKRMVYPLNFVHAYDYIKPRAVLIADAAHGIHPIAGQGLNLGLRDVAALTEILEQAKQNNEDIGSINVLKKYQTMRRADNIAMAATTDILNRVFSNNSAPFKITRKIALRLIKRSKHTKDFFTRQAMGKAGHLPKIIKNGKA